MPHVVSPFYIPHPVSLSTADNKGRKGEFSQVRDLRVAQPYRVAGANFVGTTIDAQFWISTVNAGGSYTQANAVGTLASGASASAYSILQSVRKGRFIFAHPMVFRTAVRIPTVVVAHNTRRWGVFDLGTPPATNDGFYFELSAAGALSVNCRNTGGTVTSVASGSFNGEVASYTLDTNVHAYEIHYFVMQAQFYIDGVLIHTFTPTTTNLAANLTLPISFSTENDGTGGVSGTLETWYSIIQRMGRDITQPHYYYRTGTVAAQILKRGPGALHTIVISNVSNNAVVALYDSLVASGTTLFNSGAMSNSTFPLDLDMRDMQFFTGLTLAITGANCDVTVIYE